jgi:hypothetical protein
MLSSLLAILAFQAPAVPAPNRFSVEMSGTARSTPAEGRLVVLLVREGSSVGARREPADGPFFEDPQPLFGLDARLEPGVPVLVDDAATSFPVAPSALPPGNYRAQARFDLAHLDSEWRREDGNLVSEVVTFEAPSKDPVRLRLTEVVIARPPKETEGVAWFETRSELLSKFRGRDVVLRAGVVLPIDYDPTRRYPAIYEVPGFGGNHRGARPHSKKTREDTGAKGRLAREAFEIVLDPGGPNGHSLFADSDNNGPCGEALVRELIPALEKRFPLVAQPSARMLTGHSSGGWSTLWLALTYPDVFGATWSSAPDPVDFRRFQRIDVYGDESFLVKDGVDVASYRSDGSVRMTVRQENGAEEVLGPENTSAQQWDSWFAAFGPRDARGNPAALYDVASGRIDRAIAERYRRYDLGHLLRTQTAKYAPLWRDRVRLVCGTLDSFYLNEAVEFLSADLEATGVPRGAGYVVLVPDADHGSVMASDAMRRWPEEMLEFLRR